jgi:hypothetical protein
MKYMLLIYGDEQQGNERFGKLSEEEQSQELGRWWTYTGELEKSGAMVAGDALQPTATAKTVRVDNGERLVTDGPFAETKEQLGGFYIVEVEGEEQALEWAAKMPNLPHGTVEVRPIMVFDQSS